MNQTNYFRQTLQHLRYYEEILLFSNLLQVTESEQQEAVHYLAKEYCDEAVTYPFIAPSFDGEAALWAAKTVYLASQLLLYREHREADLPALFPPYQSGVTPSAVLSADLVLRFLPDVVLQLKAIDPEDALILILETHLTTWHYSGIRYALVVDSLNFSSLQSSPCLEQLYVDRAIASQNLLLAKHPAIRQNVSAALGMYAPQLWSRFHQEIQIENETH
ncbi:MAG: hypothetical protein EOO46_01175 [Flavobacterium sp.]|nr:MAG: hypothetical protein EOO46_01175 [Flavobacterium sp.]